MSVFASAGILILSMLIMAILQLTPCVFLLFSHYSYGKYSHKNASNASLFFILGTESFTALVFLSVYFILSSLYAVPLALTNDLLVWIISGTMIAIAIIFPFCYFRKGRGTRLFISRHLAKELDHKAKVTKSRSDAFMLGFTANLPELVFSIPVYVIATIEIMKIGNAPLIRAILSLCFILIKTSPLIAIHIAMDSGQNLATIQKTRVKNIRFIKYFTSIVYLLIGVLVIVFGVFSL